MERLIAAVVGAGAAFCLQMVPDVATADDRHRIIGNYAEVLVRGGDHDFTLQAKIDTGADSTSIDARAIEEFDRDGADWVRFEVPTGVDDERIALEAEVVDTVIIIGAGGERARRLVITLGLCLGDFFEEAEVNLADRAGLSFRLLIGRDYLIDGGFLVNPAQSGEVDPACDAFEDS